MPKYQSHAAEKVTIYRAINDYITGNKSQQECCEQYGISQSIFNYYYNKTKNGTATFTVPIMPEQIIQPIPNIQSTQNIKQQIPNVTQTVPKKNKIDSWVDEVMKSSTIDAHPKSVDTVDIKSDKLDKKTDKKTDNKTDNKVDNKTNKSDKPDKKQYKKIDYKQYLTEYKSIV